MKPGRIVREWEPSRGAGRAGVYIDRVRSDCGMVNGMRTVRSLGNAMLTGPFVAAGAAADTKVSAAWGQMDAEVGEACLDTARPGRPHKNWPQRRVRSLYGPDKPRPGLGNCRLMPVPDRTSDECRRTKELREVRNQNAHGDLCSEGIDVPTVIDDFSRIQVVAGAG